MRGQESGSVEASAVSQRTFHIVALVAIVFVALTLALVVPEGLGSAGNRTLEGATPIASLPFRDEVVDATFAGAEPDGPLPSCAPVVNSFWYLYSPEADTPLSVRAVPRQGSEVALDVTLVAWTLQPDGTLIEAGCVDARGADAPEQLVLAVAGQGTHYLQVGTDIEAEAPALSLTFLADAQRPEHDLFAFAREVGMTQFSDIEVDAIDARREPGEPTASCAELAATTWYRLSAAEDATLSASVVPADTSGNAMDIAIAVYAGDAIDTLQETACVDAGGIQEPEHVELPLEGGREYAIQVGAVLGADAWPGLFDLSVAGRQTIELRPVSDTVFGAEPMPLSATADSGLPVAFEASGPCRILEEALVSDGAGTCTLTASQSGDSRWAQAPPVIVDIDISRASQAIAFGPQPDTVFGAEPLPLSAEADSGLPVTFEASGPCRILEGALVSDGAGTCTLTASQPGDLDWRAAPSVVRDVAIARAGQAIAVDAVESAVVGEPLPLSATADSGLPVSFEASGPCRILEGILISEGSGTCTITAAQPGDTQWQPAAPVTVTVSIEAGPQTIELRPVSDTVYGARPLPLSAEADSGLPVTIETSGPCRAADGSLVLEGAGLCTITASQPGDIDWQPAEPVTAKVRIAQGRQTIELRPVSDTVFGAEPMPLSATADSGLPVTFEASGPCRILEGALVSDGAGTCTLTASQPGDLDWRAAPSVVRDVAIARAGQAIAVDAVESAVVGEPLPLSATADSGLPVSFEAAGACIAEGTTVRPVGSGTCTITAHQPGDGDWQPAEAVTTTVRVGRGRQAIEVGAIGPATVGEPMPLDAEADSGLPVLFETSGPCRAVDSNLVLEAAGLCAVTASQSGDIDWQPAEPVTVTVRIDRGRQTIAFGPIDQVVVGERVPLSATADSGLPVTFEAGDPCRILEGDLVSDGAGTCTLTASQPGDTDWAPAPDVSLDVDIARATQSIEFEPVPDMVFGAEPMPLEAEADSGLPVIFGTDGPCDVVDGELASSGAGICAVTASQPGDDMWEPAAEVRRVFRIARAPQTITFAAIGPMRLGQPPLELDAAASSGLPVTYSASGPCVIEQGILSLLADGECSVSAFQAGNTDWAAAGEVLRSFPIVDPSG